MARVLKIVPASKMTTKVMDHEIGNESITKLLSDKYKTLYNSGKTSNLELSSLQGIIKNNVKIKEIRHFSVTPLLIKNCIRQLKPG